MDVFGGSGLLAHNAKQLKPQARVIYNDFDDYYKELENIHILNEWREIILNIFKKYNVAPQKKAPPACKNELMDFIKSKQEQPAFNMRLFSQWTMFSGQNCENLKDFKYRSFYNSASAKAYEADGYLDGVERIKTDFLNILEDKQYQTEKTFLILDPPYLITHPTGYKQGMHIGQYLRMFAKIKKPFIFFSSTKSDFNYLFDYAIAEKVGNYKDFETMKRINKNVIINSTRMYEDNLIYNY